MSMLCIDCVHYSPRQSDMGEILREEECQRPIFSLVRGETLSHYDPEKQRGYYSDFNFEQYETPPPCSQKGFYFERKEK